MSLKDLLFPKFCLGCGLAGTYVCPKCFRQISPLQRLLCPYCDRSSPSGLTHPGCAKRLNVDGMAEIFKYDPLLRKIIKNIKYRLARDILADLIKNISPVYIEKIIRMKKIYCQALIQPIPLTKNRLNSRGFNQAFLISKFFAEVLGLETADFLIRKNDTTPQAELKSRLARYKNVRGVFGLRPGINVKNKKIILVDDVVTTGATIKEAARVLKRFGAGPVYALSLAKG